MTEEQMQACLEAGELPGTPSEVRAIDLAYETGYKAAIAAAAARAAAHAQVNDMNWPRNIALDIIELVRSGPRHGDDR